MLLFKTFNLLELVAHLVDPVYKQRQHKMQRYEEKASILALDQRCDLLDLFAVDREEYIAAITEWVKEHYPAERFPTALNVAIKTFDSCELDVCDSAKFDEYHNRRDDKLYIGVMVQPNERLYGYYDAQLLIMNDALVDLIQKIPAKIDY